ncbi:hypothetical protein CHH69_18270 [Terribacillus saccharophilus]|nr:hypothetical protein CHH69_18270 [Terribacillus saccharophilus]
MISIKGYTHLLKLVNKVRVKNNVAPLSEQSTVWNAMFLGNHGQVIEYRKVEDPRFVLVGNLAKVPRAHEPSRDIVLEAVDHWAKIMEYYTVEVENTFIDTQTGTIISIFNQQQASEAQDLFNERFPEGVNDPSLKD